MSNLITGGVFFQAVVQGRDTYLRRVIDLPTGSGEEATEASLRVILAALPQEG